LTHAKVLHGLQLAKIERRDCAACIAAVAKNSGAVTSNRVRTSLSGFFSWAIGEGLTEQNPVIGTNRKEEKARARVLSPAELKLIWGALEDDHFAAIMKLLALTGQRAGEVAGMGRSEIDLEARLWTIPGDRTKNHRPHTVPLSNAAHAIIAAQPRRTNADGKLRDLIFGQGEGPFSGWSNSKEALDARITKGAGAALPHWTPHDLRRSFATHAAEVLKIQPHVIEAVLNHVSGFRAGVAGIYNRATYDPEKRIALDRWADQLLAWVEGRESNVTTLQRA
jgi:integrase